MSEASVQTLKRLAAVVRASNQTDDESKKDMPEDSADTQSVTSEPKEPSQTDTTPDKKKVNTF